MRDGSEGCLLRFNMTGVERGGEDDTTLQHFPIYEVIFETGCFSKASKKLLDLAKVSFKKLPGFYQLPRNDINWFEHVISPTRPSLDRVLNLSLF